MFGRQLSAPLIVIDEVNHVTVIGCSVNHDERNLRALKIIDQFLIEPAYQYKPVHPFL
ncbi:hypothetical protein D3C75_1244380 [compost metagenome]